MSIATFDKNAASVKKTVLFNSKDNKELPTPADMEEFDAKPEATSGLISMRQVQANILSDLPAAVKQMDSLRGGSQDRRAVDVSLAQFIKMKFGFGSIDSFYGVLGVDPSFHTVENLASMADFPDGYRWLIPEVIREAIRLGLRRAPIFPSLIAAEETVSQKQVLLPMINMSEATPQKVGEAETIPVGTVSFNEKTVKLNKIGTGLKVSDEVNKYVSLNVLSLYLQDVGVKLGLGLDTMAIDALINGDSPTGADAAPVIGVTATSPGITYTDILRIWLRMGRLGRNATGMLSGEDEALKVLNMEEFKLRQFGTPLKAISIKTPIPQSSDYFLHGAMPSGDKLGFIDNSSALIKLNTTGLLVESERLAARQLNATYVTQTTGFAKIFRDAFVILDGTVTIGANPFPSWMDVSAAENVIIS